MRKFVYTMFVSNNRASFPLWWKENLLKHQKVSKYFESGCSSYDVNKNSPEVPLDTLQKILHKLGEPIFEDDFLFNVICKNLLQMTHACVNLSVFSEVFLFHEIMWTRYQKVLIFSLVFVFPGARPWSPTPALATDSSHQRKFSGPGSQFMFTYSSFYS